MRKIKNEKLKKENWEIENEHNLACLKTFNTSVLEFLQDFNKKSQQGVPGEKG